MYLFNKYIHIRRCIHTHIYIYIYVLKGTKTCRYIYRERERCNLDTKKSKAAKSKIGLKLPTCPLEPNWTNNKNSHEICNTQPRQTRTH